MPRSSTACRPLWRGNWTYWAHFRCSGRGYDLFGGAVEAATRIGHWLTRDWFDAQSPSISGLKITIGAWQPRSTPTPPWSAAAATSSRRSPTHPCSRRCPSRVRLPGTTPSTCDGACAQARQRHHRSVRTVESSGRSRLDHLGASGGFDPGDAAYRGTRRGGRTLIAGLRPRSTATLGTRTPVDATGGGLPGEIRVSPPPGLSM